MNGIILRAGSSMGKTVQIDFETDMRMPFFSHMRAYDEYRYSKDQLWIGRLTDG